MRNARLRAVHARAEVLPTCLAAGFMGLTRRAAKGLRGVRAALALRPLRRCCVGRDRVGGRRRTRRCALHTPLRDRRRAAKGGCRKLTGVDNDNLGDLRLAREVDGERTVVRVRLCSHDARDDVLHVDEHANTEACELTRTIPRSDLDGRARVREHHVEDRNQPSLRSDGDGLRVLIELGDDGDEGAEAALGDVRNLDGRAHHGDGWERWRFFC